MIPLKQFICDTCQQVIQKPEDGWVEWEGHYIDHKLDERNFRICHHKQQCHKLSNHPHCSDTHLQDVLDDVLPFLYSRLDEGKFHQPEYQGSAVEDLRAFTEFMRRLTIPYYEEARLYWQDAIDDNLFEGMGDMELFKENNLKRILETYTDQSFD